MAKTIMSASVVLIICLNLLTLRQSDFVAGFRATVSIVPSHRNTRHSTSVTIITISGTQKTTIVNDVNTKWNNPFSTALLLSKGGSKSSAGTVSVSSKKIQVKLLKYVAGTGQVGDIVQVTPAFFQNKLRPTKSAVIISDEQVQQERIDAEKLEKERNLIADEIKQIAEAGPILMKKKAGPDGHLFGGIGPKAIMDELVHKVSNHNEFFEQKNVKIISMLDKSTNTILKGDIKNTGEFVAKVSLTKTIDAELSIHVQSEN